MLTFQLAAIAEKNSDRYKNLIGCSLNSSMISTQLKKKCAVPV